MGLGHVPMKDRAAQMGIEHITEILNKLTKRGHIAYAHTTRVANTYNHGPRRHTKPHKPDYPLSAYYPTHGTSQGRNSMAYKMYNPPTV